MHVAGRDRLLSPKLLDDVEFTAPLIDAALMPAWFAAIAPMDARTDVHAQRALQMIAVAFAGALGPWPRPAEAPPPGAPSPLPHKRPAGVVFDYVPLVHHDTRLVRRCLSNLGDVAAAEKAHVHPVRARSSRTASRSPSTRIRVRAARCRAAATAPVARGTSPQTPSERRSPRSTASRPCRCARAASWSATRRSRTATAWSTRWPTRRRLGARAQGLDRERYYLRPESNYH